MKPLKFLAFLIICLASFPMLAGGNGGGEKDASAAAMFGFDEAAVYQSVAELSELEQFVKVNDGISLTELQTIEHPLVANVSFVNPDLSAFAPGNLPLGIPSIVWGLCLNWVGLLIVHISEHDKSETKRALIGCIISSVLWGGGGLGYFLQ
ncbi:MAG: hypothetical protein AB8H47_19025 [Bacteroidia bacterium]